MRRGAVVLFQPHHMRAREVFLKPQDIADLGAAPTIDRLIIIAHAADVAVRLRQEAQPQVLGDVGILVFVHQNIAKPALVLIQHVRVGLENRHAVQQQITEIGGIQGFQAVLVLLIKLGATVVIGGRFRSRHAGWRPGAVFP